jgi:hypothetical protein
MLNAKNQSYENCIHTVNIVSDGGKDQNFLPLYDDLLDDKLIVNKGNNNFIHFNNMIAIKSVPNYDEYDVFIKMDDDDVYKKDYVKNIIDFFQANPDVDIVSSRINHQLNGIQMVSGNYDSLGGNPNNSTYHMPMTFAFNKKAFECIANIPPNEVGANDDLLWRYKWEDAGLKHMAVDNQEQIIWHIHGKNISTGSFLRQ